MRTSRPGATNRRWTGRELVLDSMATRAPEGRLRANASIPPGRGTMDRDRTRAPLPSMPVTWVMRGTYADTGSRFPFSASKNSSPCSLNRFSVKWVTVPLTCSSVAILSAVKAATSFMLGPPTTTERS